MDDYLRLNYLFSAAAVSIFWVCMADSCVVNCRYLLYTNFALRKLCIDPGID